MFVIRMRTVILYLAVLVVTLCTLHFCMTRPEDLPAASPAGPWEEVSLPILMYHAVTEDAGKTSRFVISKSMLEQDLQYLQSRGYHTVTMDQVIAWVEGGGTLPDNPIVLTFDDGYYNNYCYAFPLLKQYGMKAVISLIGKYTDLYSDIPEENPGYSHITWDQVKEMQASGLVEFQNHSYDLHTNTKGRNGAKQKWNESDADYARFLTEDVGLLQREMQEHTGYTPTTFTYPFGSICEASCAILEEMGFKATLGCEEKLNRLRVGDRDCLRMMRRYLRTPKNSAETILVKAAAQ